MMSFSKGTCTTDSNSINTAPHNSSNYKFTFKTFLTKIIWEFSLACVAASCHGKSNGKGLRKITNEHNKVLLLAESGASGDPQSVESSFRFSFVSQAELESMNMNSSAAATVLMVSLEYESVARELRWRRMESLENRISPVVKNLIRFDYDQILYATHNFSKDRVLGRGALSCVYRGRVGLLRTAVAIKRLNMEDKECGKAFCRELVIASSLHNPNIVPLVGFCVDSEEGLFLVYKYVSGGNLEQHLHGRWKKSVEGCSPLPWSVRYKVAIGIAEALAYLHNGTERCVVHRDIKPSNILLSSKKIPMLCDFGLATWTSAPSVPFLCRAAKGTFGYLAPEYFQHGKVSDKIDVYAFGVVLLELITGRKPIEAKGYPGEENLLLWAKPLLQKGKGAIKQLLDPQLEHSSRSSKQITHMIQAAAVCVADEEYSRPSMHEIIAILKGEVEPVLSKRKKSGYLGNGYAVIDCYPQLQQTNNEMKSHLALAMLGVSEFEDDAYLFSL